MNTALNVGKYILAKSRPEEGHLISLIHLQQLLYYCQGFHLAIHNTPLFEHEIRCWHEGPGIPRIYLEYDRYGNKELPWDADFECFPESEKEIIDEVLEVYGQFSAWKLFEFIQKEPPWKSRRNNQIISHESLKDYFKSQLIPEDEENQES